jgi:Rrf2 family transcriptional regulator, nitric oxide-sensitive transcriptional repressor
VLSQTVEYALRAAVQLASLAPESTTTADLAQVTRVPPAYLVKVLQALVKAGIVKSQRGVSGGVSLAIPADKLTILDIVNATDPIQRIKTCPLELASHGTNLCPLHRRLDAALAQVEQAFRSTSLAEVLGDPSKIRPLCEVKRRRVPANAGRVSRGQGS